MAFIGDVEGVLNKNIEKSEDHSLISGIRLFQEQHGMGSERVSPAIAMLADMGVRREDVFKVLVGLFREALVSEASTAQLDNINDLFGDVFDSLLEKPEFSAIPIAVLERQTVSFQTQPEETQGLPSCSQSPYCLRAFFEIGNNRKAGEDFGEKCAEWETIHRPILFA
mmetsp:Transcript_42226/g.164926  ORF Transcript_42226/g.164926 Transcript_42226/m.164926 type:complete len:168 (-) Transcript_42226:928-1431(-)